MFPQLDKSPQICCLVVPSHRPGVIFAIGNKGGKMSGVQTVKTEAAVVPESPKLSVVPMTGVLFIGDA